MAIALAQDAIHCDSCEETVEFFCNNCAFRLCGNCVAKHLAQDSQRGHFVVSFYKRHHEKTERIFCQTHRHDVCGMYCRTCSMPICGSCIILSHRKHNFDDINKVLFEKSKQIWNDNDMLANTIRPVLEEILDNTKKEMADKPDLYEKIRKEIYQTRTEWRDALDDVINKFLIELKAMEEKHMSRLQQQSHDINETLIEIDEARKKNTETLKSIDTIINYDSNIGNLAVVPQTMNFTLPKFVKGTSGPIGSGRLEGIVEKMNASYTIKSNPFLLNAPSIIQTIASGSSQVSDLASISADSIWICKTLSDTLMNLDISGKVLTTLTVKNNPIYISLSTENKVLFSDVKVNEVIKMEEDKMSCMIKTEGWEPRGLVKTMANEILLCQCDKDHGRIVRYNDNGILLQLIEFDSDSKPLLLDPTYIAENRNEDVCISDPAKKLVLVFDRKGKHLFSYNGNIGSTKFTALLSRVYASFYPHGIATDTLGNILVADHDNNVVHIINQWGNFLQYLMPGQLLHPRGMSIDSNGQLWVGLEEGKIKVIKYRH